jgi:hypothetical protein
METRPQTTKPDPATAHCRLSPDPVLYPTSGPAHQIWATNSLDSWTNSPGSRVLQDYNRDFLRTFWHGKVMSEINESTIRPTFDAIRRSGIVVNGSSRATNVEILCYRSSCISPARNTVSRRLLMSSPGRCAKNDNLKEWIKNHSAATITARPMSLG